MEGNYWAGIDVSQKQLDWQIHDSAIQYDPELRAYYQRKCGEGKYPKSVKNAVVCKLLYRVFAVINRGTPYVKIYEHQMSVCP